MSSRESDLERECRRHVHLLGGRLPKWTSPGDSGVPDRILLLPGQPPVFVEFKAPGAELRPKQRAWRLWLLSHGQRYWLIDDFEDFRVRVRELMQP